MAYTDKIRISNYNIYRKNGSPLTSNKPKGGVLIATHKNIPIEDMLQPISSNIDSLKIKLKITASLTISAKYAPSRTKITQIDLDQIISSHNTGHFIIGSDFNVNMEQPQQKY